MLIQFNFKNYKSFHNEAILDLSAAKMTEFSDRVVSIGGERVLPVAAIYGANASGKSNIYSAFRCMTDYVINSFNYGDESSAFKKIRPVPFLFDDETKNADTTFEVYFTIPGEETQKIYNYGFCIGNNGVTEEWLNSKARTARKFSSVFYRDEISHTLDLGHLNKSYYENISRSLEKQVLIISLGAKLKINDFKKIRDWFLNNEFGDFANNLSSFVMETRLPEDFPDDISVQKDVVNYFSSFDDSIKGFNVEKVETKDDEDGSERGEQYKVATLHKKIGSDEFEEIPLGSESSGTLKMFSLYPGLQNALKKGSVFFIDELNAKLHPLLVRNFILAFLNPQINVNHAQLIFTAHDTWQLSNHFFRRDEIWFTEKDNQGISTLYSLADFVDDDGEHIRKDESYEKNYLLGKYGAIPSLTSIQQVMEGFANVSK